MIRPTRFKSNPETAGSNAFQRNELSDAAAQSAALTEFDAYVQALRSAGVQVHVFTDRADSRSPDSIFPNNWASFHEDGTLVLYPMEAPNRRQERRECILAELAEQFDIRRRLDLSPLEQQDQYLEGTGSMVLDREHRLAYACRSSRTHPAALEAFCREMGYQAVSFNASDANGKPIYHTNVMMCVGHTLAVVCLEAVRDVAERAALVRHLHSTDKLIVDITLAQVNAFAGNMLELAGTGGAPLLAMSQSAWDALLPTQRSKISAYATPVLAPVPTIERLGGGSARCMVAELNLPLRAQPRVAVAETTLTLA
jgi:hypothetical protein